MELLGNTYRYFMQGGWVMFPIAACSIVMWALLIERLRAGRALQHADIRIAEAVQAIRSGNMPAAGDGIRARLVRRFLEERSGIASLDRNILRQLAMAERAELTRSLSSISTLASVAPLLGLLGTVIGMIETFNVISVYGTGNAKAMASGISVALITTETGLLVAIPGVFLASMLWRQSRRLRAQMEADISILDRVIRWPIPREVSRND
jgi:biopolymer transport protein ExbB